MFVGEYEYKVDNKGRLPLPPNFRKEIEDGLVLTMVADNCITAYTRADWSKMTANQAPTSFLVSDNERKTQPLSSSATPTRSASTTREG